MAGAALDEAEENVAVSIAPLSLPQRQLRPELCLRKDSENTTPRTPGPTQNTNQPPFHQKGMQVHFSTGQQVMQFIWW